MKDPLQQILGAGIREAGLQRGRRLEIRRDALLASGGNYDDFLHAPFDRLFHDVLQHRAVQDGKEFLGD